MVVDDDLICFRVTYPERLHARFEGDEVRSDVLRFAVSLVDRAERAANVLQLSSTESSTCLVTRQSLDSDGCELLRAFRSIPCVM